MIKQGQYNCILIDGEWVWDGDEEYDPIPRAAPVNLPEKPSGQPESEETTE